MSSLRVPAFWGRTSERETLDRLLTNVRQGRSQVIVVRGVAGVGKTALLRYAAQQAKGFRIAQVDGVESEMELPFAALHHLCTPMLDRLVAIPQRQQTALRVAFGVSAGEPPDRFVLALATLSLMAEVADERPLLCLVDDAQWLDGASRQILGFVARRLAAEPLGMVFAIREPADERDLVGLTEMRLDGLAEEDARALLESSIHGRLDERVRDRIVAETRGNPLALLELPSGLGATGLAGGFGLPDAADVPATIEDYYRRCVAALPEATQKLLLLAAADAVGDATLLWRAAQVLGAREGRCRAGRQPLGCSRSRRACGFDIRWSDPRCIAPPRSMRGAPHTERSRPPRIPRGTPTGVPGIERTQRGPRTRPSRRSCSTRRAGPKAAAALPRQPRFSTEQSRSPRTRASAPHERSRPRKPSSPRPTSWPQNRSWRPRTQGRSTSRVRRCFSARERRSRFDLRRGSDAPRCS